MADPRSARAWRAWGYDLEPATLDRLEVFFTEWHAVYGRPDVGAYRSREAVLASFIAMSDAAPDLRSRRQTRKAVSIMRAGYSVAVVERDEGFREIADVPAAIHITPTTEEAPPIEAGETALQFFNALRISNLARAILTLIPEDSYNLLTGFDHRDLVFVELEKTLFVKLLVRRASRRLGLERARQLLRVGHAVGYAEEFIRDHDHWIEQRSQSGS